MKDLKTHSYAHSPSAEKLLQHPFFKLAKRKNHLVSTILSDLPPLELRQDRRASLPCPHLVRISLITSVTAKPGRKPSMTHADSMSSWDFASSVPSTPGAGLANGDPFANFTTSPAGSIAVRRTPADALTPLRVREASASSSHRRGISFDLSSAPAPASPRSPTATFSGAIAEGTAVE